MATFDVTDYGAVPGASDSTSAFQDAIDACGNDGGGTVLVPEDEFTISTSTGSGGIAWCLDLSYNDVTFENRGSVVCDAPTFASAVPSLFWVCGGQKAARERGGDWFDFWMWELGVTQPTTLYDLESTATFPKDTNTVVLDTAADANAFHVGDWVAIRTGQTIAEFFGLGQPDGEIQRVRAVNTGTGTITLEDRLKTTYAQEYYISGTSGITSTSVTANPAPFAIANATDRLVHNVTITGGEYEHQPALFMCNVGNFINFHISDVRARCNGYGLAATQIGRYHTVKNCDVITYGTTAGMFWITSATTQTDTSFDTVTLTSDGPNYIHIHEGSGRCSLRNVKTRCPNSAGSDFLMGIRGRGYDIDVEGCEFWGGGTADTQVLVDTSTPGAGTMGGGIHNCRSGNAGAPGFYRVNGSVFDWRFDSNWDEVVPYDPSPLERVQEAGRVQ